MPGAITIATNMAGRGTDIQLGGNVEMRVATSCATCPTGEERDVREAAIRAEVQEFREKAIAAGGLYIVGTERHESRRIDNQLRGRSGRQGDPGRSKFFLSLQDDLMRIFGSDRMENMLVKLGLKEDEAIVHPWINKALEKAQQKVEARNFDMRKNILKYDDVMNDQRKVVFEQRREMMGKDSLEEMIGEMRAGRRRRPRLQVRAGRYLSRDLERRGLGERCRRRSTSRPPWPTGRRRRASATRRCASASTPPPTRGYAARVEKNGPDVMRYVEKQVVLQVLDHLWREHLVTLDHLRQVIGWRGLAQRDPLNEYKSEAFDLFDQLIVQLRETTTAQLTHLEVAFEQPDPQMPPMQASHFEPLASAEGVSMLSGQAVPGTRTRNGAAVLDAVGFADGDTIERDPQDPATWGKVSRNEACPCGSGKKYKHCHGALSG